MLLGRNEEKPSINVMVDNKPTECAHMWHLLKAGLSIEAGRRQRPAGCQTILRQLLCAPEIL